MYVFIASIFLAAVIKGDLLDATLAGTKTVIPTIEEQTSERDIKVIYKNHWPHKGERGILLVSFPQEGCG